MAGETTSDETTTERALPARRVSVLAEDLRLACMRISRRVRFESGETVAPHQFSVLVRLEDGPRTPRELAEIEKVSAPSMTRTARCLADAGLVARADDPADGRQVLLSLTEAGREVITTTRRERGAWMASRVAALSPQEQRVLERASEILGRIATQ